MEINDIYKINIEGVWHFVYEGTCDGIKTKWITKSKWDFKINVRFDKEKKDIEYTDSNGDEILVFDEQDVAYRYIRKD